MDGFDYYATSNISKISDYNVSNYTIIQSTIKKTGISALRINSNDNYYGKNIPSNQQILTVGFAVQISPMTTWNVHFRDGSTVNINVKFNSDGTISIYRDNTLLGTSMRAIYENTWYHFQIKVVIDSIVGSVSIKKDNEDFYSLNDINTQQGSNPWVNSIIIGNTINTKYYLYLDDLYIADDFQGICVVDTILPSSAGDSTQWTPSTGDNYACVDEVPPNGDSDFISTDVVGNIDTYNYTDLNITNFDDILAVQMKIVAKRDDLGERTIAPIIKPTTTDIEGNSKSLTGEYQFHNEILNINPETELAYTENDINNCKFGVKVTS